MRYDRAIAQGMFWSGVYLALVAVPLVVLLAGTTPASRGKPKRSANHGSNPYRVEAPAITRTHDTYPATNVTPKPQIDGDTGEPFPGANVRLVGTDVLPAATSATGAFKFPLSVDRPWLFYIEATAPGYLGETRYIAVFPDSPTYLAPFTLVRPGAGKLAGRVVAAETGTPLAGVTVGVLGAEVSIITDENGAFFLTGLNAGGLSLALGKPGYGTARVDTAVSRIGTMDVGDLFLAPLGAPPGADLAPGRRDRCRCGKLPLHLTPR